LGDEHSGEFHPFALRLLSQRTLTLQSAANFLAWVWPASEVEGHSNASVNAPLKIVGTGHSRVSSKGKIELFHVRPRTLPDRPQESLRVTVFITSGNNWLSLP
jgi:hypothetical protein